MLRGALWQLAEGFRCSKCVIIKFRVVDKVTSYSQPWVSHPSPQYIFIQKFWHNLLHNTHKNKSYTEKHAQNVRHYIQVKIIAVHLSVIFRYTILVLTNDIAINKFILEWRLLIRYVESVVNLAFKHLPSVFLHIYVSHEDWELAVALQRYW